MAGGAAVLVAAALVFPAGANEPHNPLRSGTTLAQPMAASSRVAVSLTDDTIDGTIWNDVLPVLAESPSHSLIAAETPLDQPAIVGASIPKPLSHGELDLGPPSGGIPPAAPAYADVYPAAGWIPQRIAHWFHEPWFSHSDPNDPFRHVGLGQPLVGTSWRNRPVYFGAFVGGVLTDNLTSNVYQSDTPFLGLRLGHDFDHYWAIEGRWAFARPQLETSGGEPLDYSRDYFADVSLVHYPFGDAAWRPYLLAGMGFQTYRFNDASGQRISESVFSLPLGFGVKYYCTPWFTLRFDFVDNIGFGNERVNSMHNVALMAGAEIRFGGRRPSYYPWHNPAAW